MGQVREYPNLRELPNGRFHVSVRRKGIYFRKNFKKKSDAMQALIRVEQSIETGGQSPVWEGEEVSLSLGDVLERAYKFYWQGLRGKSWGKTAMQIGREIVDILGGDLLVCHLNQNHVDQLVEYWRFKKKNSDSTLNRKLSVLSKIMQFSHSRGWRESLLKIEWFKEPKGRVRIVSPEEEAKMVSILESQDNFLLRDIVLFLLDTGLRRGELLKLKQDDLQGDNLILWETKNNTSRTVVLTARAKEIFHRREGRFNISRAHLIYSWNNLKRDMDLLADTQFVPHCLRHTCASRLIQNGVSLPLVSMWLGHKTLKTTMRYAHLCPENFEKAKDVLESYGGEV